jgi:7-cyano-7-deazaguanine synthase
MLFRKFGEADRLRETPITVLLSGGLDSSVLVGMLVETGMMVNTVNIAYGQRHAVELEAAQAIANYYSVPYRLVTLEGFGGILTTSSQTSSFVDVPEGHYEDESMKQTVVPNRNMFLLSVAAACAIDWAKFNTFDEACDGYAAHAGDHAIYPDCRPEFAEAMSTALGLCDYVPTHLFAPFLDNTKADIVQCGKSFRVPMHLTWSCYKGMTGGHCGKCGTCVERREAFARAGVQDETVYQEQ